MNLWQRFEGTRFDIWIKVAHDPVDFVRGFSLVGREMRVIGYAPVEGEMIDSAGRTMKAKCWPVKPSELFRVVPELLHLNYTQRHLDKPWLFPVEFCETFPRPKNFLEAKIRDVNLMKRSFKPPGVT